LEATVLATGIFLQGYAAEFAAPSAAVDPD